MKKNVMIIDDSALMRRILSDIIESDNRFRVAGVSRDATSAVNSLLEHPTEYDVVLLDFFLPDLNANQLLKKIEGKGVTAKIVIISGILNQDAMEVIEALECGAFDFVTKSSGVSLTGNEEFTKKVLQCVELAAFSDISKAKTKVQRVEKKREEAPISIDHTLKAKKKGSVRGEKLVALACSTGGPKALHRVIPRLNAKLNAPMLIVQHMPRGFTASLAARLDEISKVHVKEAQNGDVLQKGTVYIAQGGAQMRIEQKNGHYVIRVTDEPARGGLRPCADIMYESLVGSDYAEITCVVLTGMGGDGTQGIRKLNEKNNIYAISQNAETCTVYGMPKVFYESGLADEVLPIDEIADAICRHVGVQ